MTIQRRSESKLLSDVDIKNVLVTGWIFFLLANVFNIIFYSVHPAEVQFQKKKAARFNLFGNSIDLMKCCSRQNTTKNTFDSIAIPLQEMTSFHEQFIEHGSIDEEKATIDGIPKPKQNLWSLFPFFRSEDENIIKECVSQEDNNNEMVDTWRIFPFFSSQISQ